MREQILENLDLLASRLPPRNQSFVSVYVQRAAIFWDAGAAMAMPLPLRSVQSQYCLFREVLTLLAGSFSAMLSAAYWWAGDMLNPVRSGMGPLLQDRNRSSDVHHLIHTPCRPHTVAIGSKLQAGHQHSFHPALSTKITNNRCRSTCAYSTAGWTDGISTHALSIRKAGIMHINDHGRHCASIL